MRPNLALIVSDFNVLPDVCVEGERGPLVATKVNSSACMLCIDEMSSAHMPISFFCVIDWQKDGVTVDLSSYLDANVI